jgi:protocatechuate 3,4-dioxygenase beta subunit
VPDLDGIGDAAGRSGSDTAADEACGNADAVATRTPAPQSATGMIAGRVVDTAGSPVPNAVVFIRKGPLPATPARFPGTGTADRVLSDDAGRFVFSGLAPGPYSLETTKPGWLMGAYGRRAPGNSAVPLELTDGERRNDPFDHIVARRRHRGSCDGRQR